MKVGDTPKPPAGTSPRSLMWKGHQLHLIPAGIAVMVSDLI
jgi:hypothetical protein